MSDESFGKLNNVGQRDIDVSGSMFRTRIFLMSELIDMLDSGKLQFIGGKPFRFWSRSLKCRVVENLLVGMPPASVVIDASDPTWYVVEGAEMLNAFQLFFNNRLPLDSVNFNSELYVGKTFSGENRLSLMLQRRLTNAQIITTVADAKSAPVIRLWLYDSVLSRLRNSDRLWDCVEIIYPGGYSALKSFAAEKGIKDLRILWDVLFAACFYHLLTADISNDNDLIENKFRFVLFEYLSFSRTDTFLKFSLPPFSGSKNFLALLVKNIKKDLPSSFSEKKRICYAIVQTLVAISLKQIPPASFLRHFERAWEENKKIGIGSLDKDYMTKIRALYNTIIKE